MTPALPEASRRRLEALHPPAVWTAFASQGRWKNWVMLAQLALLALMTQVCFALARTEPDVVVVDDAGGGHYLPRTASSEALLRFLNEETRRPTDVTLLHFTGRFVRLTAAVNSATFEESWAEAVSMMAAPLGQQMEAQALAQRLAETYRLAQVRTELELSDVQLVERRGSRAHLRVLLSRQRVKLFSATASAETLGPRESLQVDLVLAEVPRSRRRPDGLEVLEWHTTAVSPAADGGPATPPGSPL